METVVFGGGCFWCTEAVFQKLKGVISVDSGYAGGTTENPDYWSVAEGDTGHAEVVNIEYDPSIISFTNLLDVFFATHDPTTLNQQGYDVGTDYRSVIFTTTEEQTKTANNKIQELNEKEYAGKIVTTVEPLKEFFTAEEYHKNYFVKHEDAPYCSIIIAPKLQKLLKKFPELIKEK